MQSKCTHADTYKGWRKPVALIPFIRVCNKIQRKSYTVETLLYSLPIKSIGYLCDTLVGARSK